MELNHSGYRTISKLSLLSPEAVETVKHALKQHTGITGEDLKHYNFKAVLNGRNQLLAFVSFSLNGKECQIHFIWGNAAQRDFIKNYGVASGQYLLEDFVRKGIKGFKFFELYESAKKMFVHMKTRRHSEFDDLSLSKLFSFSLQDIYTREIVTRKTVALANSRKTLRRGGKKMRVKRNLVSSYKPPRRLTKRNLKRNLLK